MQPSLRHRIPWAALMFLAAACVPWLGSRFYTFLATDIAILALFAVSLNLLLGYTGLVSFGHAAYFGIGAYTCAILMKTHGVPFALALIAGSRERCRSGRSCSAHFACARPRSISRCSRSPSRRSSGRCASSGIPSPAASRASATSPIPSSTGWTRCRCSAGCAPATSSISSCSC